MFSAIPAKSLSTVLKGSSLFLAVIVSSFGYSTNITSELQRKASFINPPSENGFPCLSMHCASSKLPSVALYLTAHGVVNPLLCFSHRAGAFLIDSTLSLSSSKFFSCLVSKRCCTQSDRQPHRARSFRGNKSDLFVEDGRNRQQ